MESSLAFKLVVAIPSFLFIIGFLLKGILEAYNLKKIDQIISQLDSEYCSEYDFDLIKDDLNEIFRDFHSDFFYVFSLESLFVLVVNGLIIIFEFNKIEFGIILIIVSLVIFLLTTIGSHTGNQLLVVIGIILTMTILGWEFGYFLSYDLETIWGIQSQNFIYYTIFGCYIIAYIVMYSFVVISRNIYLYKELVSRIKKKMKSD